MKIREKVSVTLQAALISTALRMQYGATLYRENYKSALHYFYAEVTQLLGEFDLNGLLLFVLAVIFICRSGQNIHEKYASGRILPFFFSFCLLIGQSYAQTGDWNGCFGSVFQFLHFLTAFFGYAVLFRYLIPLFFGLYQRAAESGWKPPACLGRFSGEKSFRNVFLLLMLLWLPVLLLNYPANLCYDFIGQVSQALGVSAYSSHHPLLHTLIAGNVIKLGRALTGSVDFGLFLYMLLQMAALAAALAGTVARMAKRQVSQLLRLLVSAVYVFAPMYSNMASTAVKDIPFMAAFIWYLLLLEELVAEGAAGKTRTFAGKLLLAEVLTGLLRNNGIYVVVLTGIVFGVCLWKKAGKRNALRLLTGMVVLPGVLCFGINATMSSVLSAEKGSIAEALSIPFQQTARYLTVYGDSLTAQERETIESVLGDVGRIAERYNPDSSDPVKALYHKDCGIPELAAYFKVWAADFFKHPDVYFQAFFAHVYGWFDPGVTNSIRYEAETELFRQGGLIPGADKLLLFVYRFAAYVPFLEILENVGVYTWLLFLLAGMAIRKREKRGLLLTPLFVSLLICMASPCFYLHPRYAYPIMFTIPFLYGILSRRTKGMSAEAEVEVCK